LQGLLFLGLAKYREQQLANKVAGRREEVIEMPQKYPRFKEGPAQRADKIARETRRMEEWAIRQRLQNPGYYAGREKENGFDRDRPVFFDSLRLCRLPHHLGIHETPRTSRGNADFAQNLSDCRKSGDGSGLLELTGTKPKARVLMKKTHVKKSTEQDRVDTHTPLVWQRFLTL
jgi:hypothetical protein